MTATVRNNDKMHHMAMMATVSYNLTGEDARAVLLAQEMPIAVVLNGTTVAVMMASPKDIKDFAYGFVVSEGFVQDLEEVEEFQQIAHENGIEARFWLTEQAQSRIEARRRVMAGPVGCGLCGIDSLAEALRDLPKLPVSAIRFDTQEVVTAPDLLRQHQPLHDQARAAHAAGFLQPGQGIVIAREDVGRHNALDKLLGALLHAGINPSSGAVVMTSRVSIELVQKLAIIRCPLLIAVSAPTAQAVKTAHDVGLALVANVKLGNADVFTAPTRINGHLP